MIKVIEFELPEGEPELGVELGYYEMLTIIDTCEELDYIEYGRFEIDEFIIQVFSDESRWTYIKVDKDNLRLIHKGKNY